jgi:hypothetical protein
MGFGSTLPLFSKVVQKFGSTFSKGGYLAPPFPKVDLAPPF